MHAFLDSFSILIVFSIIVLYVMTFLSTKKSRQLSTFRWLLVWIILWLLSNYVLEIFNNHLVILAALRASFLTSILMVYTLYQFGRVFPNTLTEPGDNTVELIVKVATAGVGILSLSNLLVEGYTKAGAMVLAQYAVGYDIYVAYILVMLAITLYSLVVQYRISSKLTRQQTQMLFVGLISSTIIITTVELVVPIILHSDITSNYGPYGIIFWVVCAYLALTERHLFAVKVLLSELWAFLLLFVIFAWLVLHFSVSNLFGFLFVASICVLFIRAVISEAEKETQLENANRQLAEDKKKLVEVDKLKDDFISMASHELNTPISAIKGYLSMVLDEGLGGKVPDKAREYLETVFQSAQRLSEMVNDLLNVSRIESGRIHLIWERKPIEKVIRQAITEVASKAREAKHVLLFKEPKKAMPLTWFDVTRVTEILINLLGNAIKYTPNGGRIIVRVTNDSNNITVSVEDNGKGIPKDKANLVFQKFTQVNTATDEHKGTGLGMYISKKFIELHHGKIWFDSEGEAKGTTFYFSLPIIKDRPFDPHEGEGGVLR